jgi:NACalpha-BTF3-like transcription factor
MTDLEKLMAEIAKRNGASQFSLNGGASPLGDGMAKAQSVFDAPQQMQGSVGVSPAQTEAQGQAQDDRSFFQKAGDFLGTNQLGNNIGSFIGSQKYGTGISAEGEVTGRPLGKNTTPLFVLDPHSEAFFGKIRDFAQDGVNAVGDVAADLISESSGGRINLQSNQPVKNEVVGSNAGAISTPISSIAELNSLIYAPPEATTAQPAASQGQVAEAQPQAFSLPDNVAEGSPQGNFLTAQSEGRITPEQLSQAGDFAKSIGTTFDPVTGYSRQPFLDSQAPTQATTQPQGLTTVGGQPLSEFMSGAAMPESGFARAENPMFGENSGSRGLTGDAGRSAFDQASADREARAAESFGQPRGPDSRDRDRRAARGEGISDADRRDIAKANMSGASASDIARGMKVADLNGLDLRTGQPVKTDKPMTEKEQLQVEEQKKLNEILDQRIVAGNNPEATGHDKNLGEQSALWKAGMADGTLEQWEVDAQRKDFYKKPAPANYNSWVEYEAEQRGAVPDLVDTTVDGYTTGEESGIKNVMDKNSVSREVAIKALEDGGKLKKISK